MQKSFGFFGALAALMLSGSSSGQIDPSQPTLIGAEEHGFQFGVRSGYAIPFGTAYGIPGQTDTANFKDVIKGMIPIWGDVGYRFNPNWYVGGFFQFGIGLVPSNSDCSTAGVSCSENDLRFGLNFHYHMLPEEGFDPWIGLGAGYEIVNQSLSVGSISGSGSLKGFEFGNLQLGLDLKLSPAFAVGPFVAFTIAQFSDVSASALGVTFSPNIDKKIHEWLLFGVRGIFNLNLD